MLSCILTNAGVQLMKRIQSKVSAAIKSQILAKLIEPGVMVSDLAKLYGLSKSIIYAWQQEARKVDDGCRAALASQFVEVSVKTSNPPRLEKASLVFSDFSLCLEGRIQSSSLVAIMQILEESSC
jgi:transposase-like protein